MCFHPAWVSDIALEHKDEKNILKIILAGGHEKPFYIRKYVLSERGTFICMGSASELKPVRMIETLFAKRMRQSIGKIKSPRKDTPQDLMKLVR